MRVPLKVGGFGKIEKVVKVVRVGPSGGLVRREV